MHSSFLAGLFFKGQFPPINNGNYLYDERETDFVKCLQVDIFEMAKGILLILKKKMFNSNDAQFPEVV